MKVEFKKLDDINKIAAIKASSSLSKMIRQPVGVDISKADFLRNNGVHQLMENNECVAALLVRISGDLKGMAFLCFPSSNALVFSDYLLHKEEGTSVDFREPEISALAEVANIVIGNFLGLFSHPLKLDSVMHHAPEFKLDNFGTLIQYVENEIKHKVNDKIMIEIIISLHHFELRGYLVFMIGYEEMKRALEQ